MQQSHPPTRQDCQHFVSTTKEKEETLDPRTHGTKEAPQYNGPRAHEFAFALDSFQELAIACVERRESVLVAAHTSAGKTVVAEYACAAALRDKQKVVYTSPIKALSNQKYREFDAKFRDRGEGSVGLMTGDVTIHPHAPIIVMTTEILRSMLYRASDMLADIAWVIFDEVHYMQDRERGVVWEETIIILPHEIRMIFLSATLPNANEFADWIAHLHHQPCHVVYTEYRPTPLKHYGYAQGGDLMLTLVDSKTGAFKPEAFDDLMVKLKESKDQVRRSHGIEEDENGRWKKAAESPNLPTPSKFDDLRKLVNLFKTNDFLPVIVFCFGKRTAEQNATSIVEVMDLTTDDEKEQVDFIFEKAICNLSDADRSLPVIENVRGIVRQGVGIHHSGMLPLLKEITEILFQESLVKVLCATETFAMGLNMPARTVLFTSTKKFDGVQNRTMSSGEYIQMSGRAGRRGKDKKGFVVVMLDEYANKDECKEIMMGKPCPLKSSFRLSYYTLLNLLQKVEGLKRASRRCVRDFCLFLGTQQSIDDIIRKSFNQFQHDRSIPHLQEQLNELEKKAAELTVDKAVLKRLRRAKELRKEIDGLRKDLNSQKLQHVHSLLLWTPGRLIQVKDWGVGIVMGPLSPAFSDPYFLDVALPCIETSIPEKPYQPADVRTTFSCFLGIFPVFLNQVEEVFRISIDVPLDLTKDAEKTALLEQFRGLMKGFDGQLPVARWIEDIDVDDASILTKIEQMERLEQELYEIASSSDFEMTDDMEPQVEEKISVMMQIEQLKKDMENTMMASFQEEYRARVAVLRRLGHINTDGVLTLKGKAACEIDAGDELVCAELLFDGTLKKLERSYIISFLSCLVPFTDHVEESSTEQETLHGAFENLKTIARRIGDVSVECKVEIDVEEYVESFHLCFVDVMHAWETGSAFIDVCKMSEIYEGVIIRSARRLAELIQQMASAARVMGDMELVQQLEESNVTLKRDIMFAASLYV